MPLVSRSGVVSYIYVIGQVLAIERVGCSLQRVGRD